MGFNFLELITKYKKAEKFMENPNVTIEEKTKHMNRFVELIKDVDEATKGIDSEILRRLLE
jgi:hypothetical protein